MMLDVSLPCRSGEESLDSSSEMLDRSRDKPETRDRRDKPETHERSCVPPSVGAATSSGGEKKRCSKGGCGSSPGNCTLERLRLGTLRRCACSRCIAVSGLTACSANAPLWFHCLLLPSKGVEHCLPRCSGGHSSDGSRGMLDSSRGNASRSCVHARCCKGGCDTSSSPGNGHRTFERPRPGTRRRCAVSLIGLRRRCIAFLVYSQRAHDPEAVLPPAG